MADTEPSPLQREKSPTTVDDGAAATIIKPRGKAVHYAVKVGDLPPEIPVRLGKYSIDSLIGRGAMGAVYKARQDGLNRVVALKIMLQGPHASPKARARFTREARAMAKLRHPHIIAVHEVGEFEGQPFFTMDFIQGVSLAQFIRKIGFATTEDAARLAVKLADAVHYAHRQGIVHRDLKPGNILIDEAGEPVITDFGLAKENDDEDQLSMSGDILGTPSFMPPEQASGHLSAVDERSDVYALGAVLYVMLTKQEPFPGGNLAEMLNRVIRDDPKPVTQLNPGVSADLGGIVMKAMEKQREYRYPSAGDLAEDLRRFLDGRPTVARPWTWRQTATRWLKRNRRQVAYAFGGVLLLVATAVLAPRWFGRSFVDVMEHQLTSEKPEVRATAMAMLGREIQPGGQVPDEDRAEALALLAVGTQDVDPRVRMALLQLLADPAAIPVIAPALDDRMVGWLMERAGDDSYPEQRNLALMALGQIRREEVTKYLLDRIHEPNPAVRLQVIRSLGQHRAKAALGPLFEVAAADPVCRAEAQAALDEFFRAGRLGIGDRSDQMGKQILRTASQVVGNYNAQMEQMLAELDGGGKPVDPVEQALASADVAERLEAVRKLGQDGTPEAYARLVQVFEDESDGVASAAALQISRGGCAGLGSTLVATLDDANPRRRGYAALALGLCGQASPVNDIMSHLAVEKDAEAARLMIAALVELNAREAVPLLHEISRRDEVLRSVADEALNRLKPRVSPSS